MAHSNIGSVENVTRLLMKINPDSILDVGVGFGQYGFMARMWLDARRDETWAGVNSECWKRQLHGVEPWCPFARAPHIAALYDNVFEAEAKEFFSGAVRHYDLIILSHVLEHMVLADGLFVLACAMRWGRNVIVGLPVDCAEETDPDDFGNPYGPHLSDWQDAVPKLVVQSSFHTVEEGAHHLLWLKGERYVDQSVPGWVDRFR